MSRDPSATEKALEAARDDPDLTELGNMLLDLPHVYYVDVDGDHVEYRPTRISVNLDDDVGRGSGALLKLMSRAGWNPVEVCFSRNRIGFEKTEHLSTEGADQ